MSAIYGALVTHTLPKRAGGDEVLVVGVDAGGTKTEACLAEAGADGTFQILGRAQAGPGNPRSAGFAAANSALEQSIHDALRQADVSIQQVQSMCLAVAGAGRQEEQMQLSEPMRAWGLRCAPKFVHDGWAALAAAFHDAVGVAVIAGTGSLAFGRNASGATSRAGGWGYLLGDEGSGYQLALSALQAVARTADGRGGPTRLTEQLLQACQCQEPSQLIGFVHDPATDRHRIARLAPVVMQTALDGDTTAQDLVRQAASDLAHLVAVLVDRLGFTLRGYPLGLAGGLLVHHAEYRKYVEESLRRQGKHPGQVEVVASPVVGAVRLAAMYPSS